MAVTIVAIIGAVSTLLSVGCAGWASIKARRTDDVRLGYEAMRDSLANYREDNKELRSRMVTAEKHIVDLTAQVNRCEADKVDLHRQVEALQREVKP